MGDECDSNPMRLKSSTYTEVKHTPARKAASAIAALSKV
ncbi:MAG: hypothetical protein ACI808_001290 [Paraglaciecola sp.]|jgi:hypothetical protein